MMHRIAAALLVSFALVALNAADLKQVTLGTYVSGPKIDAASLVGKVVLFEFWGVNCPPCRANIPHISELASMADAEQLAVIANHCQEPGKTVSVWKECGGTDAPTVIEHGDLPGAGGQGIPHLIVFDANGSQVFDGHPASFTKEQLQKLLDAAPSPMVPKGTYKECAKEAAYLASKAPNVGPTIKGLRAKAAKGSEEAKTLVAAVDAYADKRLAMLTAARDESPMQAVALLTRMSTLLKGDIAAKPFDALAATWKADKAFQVEIAAGTVLAKAKATIVAEQLSGKSPAESKRVQAAQMAKSLDELIKRYPDTMAAKEAASVRNELLP